MRLEPFCSRPALRLALQPVQGAVVGGRWCVGSHEQHARCCYHQVIDPLCECKLTSHIFVSISFLSAQLHSISGACPDKNCAHHAGLNTTMNHGTAIADKTKGGGTIEDYVVVPTTIPAGDYVLRWR